MSEDGNRCSVKEVKQPIVQTRKSNAKFVDLVPEKVRFRSSKLVTKLRESLDLHKALSPGFRRQGLKPLQHWHCSIIMLVKNYCCPRHAVPLSRFRIFANLTPGGSSVKYVSSYQRCPAIFHP